MADPWSFDWQNISSDPAQVNLADSTYAMPSSVADFVGSSATDALQQNGGWQNMSFANLINDAMQSSPPNYYGFAGAPAAQVAEQVPYSLADNYHQSIAGKSETPGYLQQGLEWLQAPASESASKSNFSTYGLPLLGGAIGYFDAKKQNKIAAQQAAEINAANKLIADRQLKQQNFVNQSWAPENLGPGRTRLARPDAKGNYFKNNAPPKYTQRNLVLAADGGSISSMYASGGEVAPPSAYQAYAASHGVRDYTQPIDYTPPTARPSQQVVPGITTNEPSAYQAYAASHGVRDYTQPIDYAPAAPPPVMVNPTLLGGTDAVNAQGQSAYDIAKLDGTLPGSNYAKGVLHYGSNGQPIVGTGQWAAGTDKTRYARGGAAHGGCPTCGGLAQASRYVKGGTAGQADKIPAMLSDGEYVFDADTVANLGDGNNEAGAAKLDQMRQSIRKHKRSAKPTSIPPQAKDPMAYLKGRK